MKYQIGDDILVLHSNEEGKVIDIINDEMVMIEIRGVRFPAYMNQIDFPYYYRFTKNTIVESKAKENSKKVFTQSENSSSQKLQIKTEKGVWLALIPKFEFDDFDDEIVSSLKVFIINNSSVGYNFTYELELNATSDFLIEKQIAEFAEFYIHDIPFENLNDSPNFFINFSHINSDKNKSDFFETNVKLKPKQIFQKIESLKKHNELEILFNLFTEYPDKIEKEYFDLSKLANKGFKVYDASKIRENLEPARSVVDLHIEKIISDWSGKSNAEIISIQINEFEK